MARSKRTAKRKRTGIFVYCDSELKHRIERARRYTQRTISGYVLHATLKELEADEARMPAQSR